MWQMGKVLEKKNAYIFDDYSQFKTATQPQKSLHLFPGCMNSQLFLFLSKFTNFINGIIFTISILLALPTFDQVTWVKLLESNC